MDGILKFQNIQMTKHLQDVLLVIINYKKLCCETQEYRFDSHDFSTNSWFYNYLQKNHISSYDLYSASVNPNFSVHLLPI